MTPIDDDLLRQWSLPEPDSQGDKEERGRVLVIAGSREMPGAALLAATAALRVGAGKLAIGAGESIAAGLALAIPESRVIALPETNAGGLAPIGVERLATLSARLDALLVGPGMQDEATACEFVRALLPHFESQALVLDALAMGIVAGAAPLPRPAVLTPHAGEMAHLLGCTKEAVQADPATCARNAATRWNAVVVLKGAVTHIAEPGGRLWRHEDGHAGLATSGSGDTLAGLMAGLAARGCTLEQACVWGVALHARAGHRLSQRLAPLGFLARELAAEVPAVMGALRG